MATRQETQQRRQAMRDALIEECRGARALSGAMLPPVHELSRRHGLSVPLVSETIQELVREGVLHTRRGAGTFVGRLKSPGGAPTDPFLLLLSDDGSGALHRAAIRRGFEDCITQHGGSSLSLSVEAVRQLRERGAVLAVSGIFDFHETPEGLLCAGDSDVPRVEFGGSPMLRTSSDIVDFDNVAGGRQATEHLLRQQHKRIAFLGVHAQKGEPNQVGWSAERAEGWKQALQSANRFSRHLLFTSSAQANDEAEQGVAARTSAVHLVRELTARAGIASRAITAVVAVNHITAYQMLEALAASPLPSKHWPSIVAFDEKAEEGGHVLSTLRLPWEEIGSVAADMLWQRSQDIGTTDALGISRKTVEPLKRLVPMKLVSRLTCQPVWSSTPGALALALPGRREAMTTVGARPPL